MTTIYILLISDPFVINEEWGFWFKIISTPIIVLVGIIGNSLSLLVMRSDALKNKSYSHYLCALAVFDTLTLIINLIATVDEYYMYYSLPGIFHNFTNFSCKLYNFLSHVITLMSSWIIVLMAVVRTFRAAMLPPSSLPASLPLALSSLRASLPLALSSLRAGMDFCGTDKAQCQPAYL